MTSRKRVDFGGNYSALAEVCALLSALVSFSSLSTSDLPYDDCVVRLLARKRMDNDYFGDNGCHGIILVYNYLIYTSDQYPLLVCGLFCRCVRVIRLIWM